MRNFQDLSKLLGYIFGLSLMQILVLPSLAAAGQPESYESIAGCYYELVTPISQGDGRPHPAYSTLEFVPIGKDYYKFSIEVVGGNFHMCGARGIAVVKKRGKNPVLEMVRDNEQIEEEAKWGSESCQLTFRFTRNKVIVDHEGDGCRSWCGARAAFSDADFTRKNKAPKCNPKWTSP